MKAEIIKAIKDLNIDDDNFYHFDMYNESSHIFNEEIKTENLWIDITYKLYVKFNKFDELIYTDVDVLDFKVWNHFGELINTKKLDINSEFIEELFCEKLNIKL